LSSRPAARSKQHVSYGVVIRSILRAAAAHEAAHRGPRRQPPPVFTNAA